MNIVRFCDIQYARMPEWLRCQPNVMPPLATAKDHPTGECTETTSKPRNLKAEVIPTCPQNWVGVSVKGFLWYFSNQEGILL